MHNHQRQSDIDYTRIAEAIAYLRRHHRQQPKLGEIAAHLRISEAHLQKMFLRFAGISPKRFLQFLSVEYAKRCMAQTGDLLSLSHTAGLSGPGRLHDLFVTLEALSPGEFKRAAAGMDIAYGVHQTPFGPALIAHTQRGICHLAFTPSAQQEDAVRALQAQWPAAVFCHRPEASAALLERIFRPGPGAQAQPLAVWVSGSNFQIQVWRALLRIPFSGLLSYRQVAAQLGKPRAARAVGNAVANNPLAYIIPCHRVLQSSGDFGIYHWGAERKAAMVAWEAALTPGEAPRCAD